jgi:hypothetical protein
MVERLPRFQRQRADLIAPRIDFLSAAQAEARGYENMADAVGRMSQFAFEKAGESAQAAGIERGAKEAPEVLQELMGKDPAFMTIREKAAYETATKVMGAQVEADARLAMQEILIQAEAENAAPEVISDRLNDAVDGFSISLRGLSPEAEAQVKLRLSSMRDTSYLQASERFLKNEQEKQTAKFSNTVASYMRTIEQSGAADVRPEVLEQQIASLADFMESAGFSPAAIARDELRARSRFHRMRVDAEFSRLETPAQRKAFVAELDRQKRTGGELVEGLDADSVDAMVTGFSAAIRSDAAAAKRLVTDLSSVVEKNITKLTDKGYYPDPSVVSAVETQADKLEASGADVSEIRLALAVSDRRAEYNKALNGVGIDDLRAEERRLKQALEENGATEEEFFKYELIKKRVNTVQEELKADPINWFQSTGQVADTNLIQAIGSGDPDSLVVAVRDRVVSVDENWARNNLPGRPEYLNKDEAVALTNFFDRASVDGQIVVLGDITDAFGTNASQVFAQVSGKSPLMAHLGGLVVMGSDPSVVRSALDGSALLKAGVAVPEGEKADKDKTRLAFFADSGLDKLPSVRAGIRETAEAIYSGIAAGRTEFDRDKYEEALEMAAGQQVLGGTKMGGFAEFNNKKVIVPTFLETDGGLEELIEGATPDELAIAMGGLLPLAQDNEEIGHERLLADMSLYSIGDGVYQVYLSQGGADRPLIGPTGGVATLNVYELREITSNRPVPLEPGLMGGELPTPATTEKALTLNEKMSMGVMGVTVTDSPEADRAELRKAKKERY